MAINKLHFAIEVVEGIVIVILAYFLYKAIYVEVYEE